MIAEEIDEETREKNKVCEIDEEYMYFYRRMVWEAFEELVLPDLLDAEPEEYLSEEEDASDEFYQLKYKSTDLESWELAIDCLANRIFWDRDWFLVSQDAQLLDGMDEILASTMGREENYFTNRLPKVTDEQAQGLLREILEWELPENIP